MTNKNKQEISRLEGELVNIEHQMAVLKRKYEKNPDARIDSLHVDTLISSIAGREMDISFEKKFYEIMERSGIDKLSLERDMPDISYLLRYYGLGIYVDLNKELNLGAVIYAPQNRNLFGELGYDESVQKIKVFEIKLPEDARNREKKFECDDGRIIKEYFLKKREYLFDKIKIESTNKEESIDIMLEGRKIPTHDDIIRWELDGRRYAGRFRLPANEWREVELPHVPYKLLNRKERFDNLIICLDELKIID